MEAELNDISEPTCLTWEMGITLLIYLRTDHLLLLHLGFPVCPVSITEFLFLQWTSQSCCEEQIRLQTNKKKTLGRE